MSQAPPGGRAPLDTEPVPGDADDTRGRRFNELIRSGPALISLLAAAVVAFIVGSLVQTPLIGLAAAAGAAILGVGIVYAIAMGRAEDDFFRAYASSRNLRWEDERGGIVPATPLLRKGDKRRTDLELTGTWPSGFEGQIAHYVYTEVSHDSKGRRQETDYDFTVGITTVPLVAEYLREISAQRRSGFRFLDGAEDVFRSRQRVEHESEELDRRFEIFIDADDDMSRALQVLEPSFVVWLSENTPESFAFECCAGTLVTAVTGHKSSAIELDALAEASAAVATRLREEAAE